MVNNLGFDITTSSEIREDAFLFGESPSRVIVSVREVKEDRFLDLLKKSDLPFSLIGIKMQRLLNLSLSMIHN